MEASVKKQPLKSINGMRVDMKLLGEQKLFLIKKRVLNLQSPACSNNDHSMYSGLIHLLDGITDCKESDPDSEPVEVTPGINALLQACQALVDAYEKGEESNSICWEDIDNAYALSVNAINYVQMNF